MLTFLADAEKARVWMREAMNILGIVTVVKLDFAGDRCRGWWRENKCVN